MKEQINLILDVKQFILYMFYRELPLTWEAQCSLVNMNTRRETTESEYILYVKADFTFPSHIKAFPGATTKNERTKSTTHLHEEEKNNSQI